MGVLITFSHSPPSGKPPKWEKLDPGLLVRVVGGNAMQTVGRGDFFSVSNFFITPVSSQTVMKVYFLSLWYLANYATVISIIYVKGQFDHPFSFIFFPESTNGTKWTCPFGSICTLRGEYLVNIKDGVPYFLYGIRGGRMS